MSEIKFRLTSESKVNIFGVKLFRIEATVSFGNVRKGDKGGWVESTHVSNGNARVSGNAWVSGNAQVYGNAQVSDDAWVYGNARVSDDAQVYGDAWVFGDARVSLKRLYKKGSFIYASDEEIKTSIIDQSKEEGFADDRDYRNLLVVGDYEIEEIEATEEAKPETINIGGKKYEVTDDLKKALQNLKEV